MLEATTFTKIYGQQRLGKKVIKYSNKKFSYIFSVRKYFYNEKKANYGI